MYMINYKNMYIFFLKIDLNMLNFHCVYCRLEWVDIGFRLEIKLGYTETPITLKKMTLKMKFIP